MKKEPAKIFVLLSFESDNSLIESLRSLEDELGESFYFTVNFSVSNHKNHRLMGYNKRFYREDLRAFFASKKRLRRKIRQSLSEAIFGCVSLSKVESIHEDDSPYRIYVDGYYQQVQLVWANYTYLPISGTLPVMATKTAITFFSDLRRFLAGKGK
ncbi:MAG: hypothetical protein NZM25_06080 [Leptospiraceae bacterium]|nr:hypothetical protein [Leptospiraceae bacterium]MDW8306656.1 hypothetical protein [Leptospiraceae bacterium]